jgi:hypothetical protein
MAAHLCYETMMLEMVCHFVSNSHKVMTTYCHLTFQLLLGRFLCNFIGVECNTCFSGRQACISLAWCVTLLNYLTWLECVIGTSGLCIIPS